jgi:hypothetical protein
MSKHSIRIFLATLVALVSVIGIPLDIVITRNGYRAIGIGVASSLGLVGIVAGLLALRWSRESRSAKLGQLFVMATFGWAIVLTGIGGALAHYGTATVCQLSVNPGSPGPPTAACATPSVSTQHAIGVGLLALAVVLIFASLVTVPSSERELLRRIDLEASAVAVGVSFFFFIVYASFRDAFSLPVFSNGGVAVWTLLISYLLGRLALTIRYR